MFLTSCILYFIFKYLYFAFNFFNVFPFLYDIFFCLCVDVLCLLLSVYSVFIIEEIKLFFKVQNLSNYHYFIII